MASGKLVQIVISASLQVLFDPGKNDEIDEKVEIFKDCSSFNNRRNPKMDFKDLSLVNYLYPYAENKLEQHLI